MKEGTSLGLVETRGLIGAVTAADAMLKAAAVELTRKHKPGGARVVVMCRGDLSSCAAAVAAGAQAAAEVGALMTSSVLARPEEGADSLCEELLDQNTERRAAYKAARKPACVKSAPAAPVAATSKKATPAAAAPDISAFAAQKETAPKSSAPAKESSTAGATKKATALQKNATKQKIEAKVGAKSSVAQAASTQGTDAKPASEGKPTPEDKITSKPANPADLPGSDKGKE